MARHHRRQLHRLADSLGLGHGTVLSSTASALWVWDPAAEADVMNSALVSRATISVGISTCLPP
jgi:hypothetical protein